MLSLVLIACLGLPSAWGLLRYQQTAVRQMKEAELAAQALHDLAYRDSLTGAENRRSFMERLGTEFVRLKRTHSAAVLIMLDIDFFKRVNDTFGHDMGDAVLCHLVAVLQSALRGMDTLGRLGGEEFAVLLPETSMDAATLLAERLRQAVESCPANLDGKQVAFTISLGVTTLTADTPDVNFALKQADAAMYQAKHMGRNRVCVA